MRINPITGQQELEENSPAWKIFNIYFNCTVRAIDNYTTDYLEQRGFPTTGDAKRDRSMARSLVYREMPIKTMVELFNNGATVNVCKPSDTKIIYDIITAHLDEWKHYLSTRLNTGNAPVEDLMALDRFANEVYKHAKEHIPAKPISFFLNDNAAARMKHAVYKSFGKEAPETSPVAQVELPDKRVSLANAFKEHVTINNGGKKWS